MRDGVHGENACIRFACLLTYLLTYAVYNVTYAKRRGRVIYAPYVFTKRVRAIALSRTRDRNC